MSSERKRNLSISQDPAHHPVDPLLSPSSQPSKKPCIVQSDASPTDISPDLYRKPISQIVSKQFNQKLRHIRANYHQHFSELHLLQRGMNIIKFYDTIAEDRPSLAHSLRSGHLDDEDLREINLYEQNIAPAGFFPPRPFSISARPKRAEEDDDEEVDDDAVPDRVKKEQEIYDKAMEEARVLQRIVELKRQDLWSENTLESASEPLRSIQVHHVNYFAEMDWLSQDFQRERRWKKASAKKLAHAAMKVIKEKEERERRAEKDASIRVRKLAATVSKMIRDWWRQIDKVVKAKQNMRLSVKRQEAMSTHLGKVIETTEKFTEWLTEGMLSAGSGGMTRNASATFTESVDSQDEKKDVIVLPERTRRGRLIRRRTVSSEPKTSNQHDEDAEWTLEEQASESESDVEDTIAQEEALANEEGMDTSVLEEIQLLQKESEIPMEELLNQLPPEMLNTPAENAIENSESSSEESLESEEDVEDTIAEQEKFEGTEDTANYDDELKALEDESEMPLEELRRKLQSVEMPPLGEYEDNSECDDSDSDTESNASTSSNSSNNASVSYQKSNDNDSHRSSSPDLSTLLVPSHELIELPAPSDPPPASSTGDEINDAKKKSAGVQDDEFNALSEAALSALPRGFTLDSTQVGTPVPFLLKHTLREYQWVGLDWLATIYEKRLNGILADEMGLGKTIQTISLMAHLACEKGIWGPHLIVVPTSVIVNWEVEFKKWCPAFKILTYYGGLKERKEKRKGWTKPNAFHVCITSYKLAIQDSGAFRRKKWKYLVLDEAQNIKNFKSQRWQTLLTFNSQRRLLLTGTPLQNSLMELWSLMHFLMPHVFQSHREFQEWFASPLTGMVEGNSEYNEHLVRRLHKVLRPFILRRLKKDVEKQMPKKYEHVVMCPLSRRQRFLYHDFLTQSSTKESLASGSFMCVIGILMQLRKVCNHPNLFEPRPILSPFVQDREDTVTFHFPSLFCLRENNELESIPSWWPNLCNMARDLPSFVSERVFHLRAKPHLIQEVDHVTVQTRMSGYSNLKPAPCAFISKAVYESLQLEAMKPTNRLHEAASPKKLSNLPNHLSSLQIDKPGQTKYIIGPRAMESTNHKAGSLPQHILECRKNYRSASLVRLSQLSELRCIGNSPPIPDITSDTVDCARRLFLTPCSNASNGFINSIWACAEQHSFLQNIPNVSLQQRVKHWEHSSPTLQELVSHMPNVLCPTVGEMVNKFVFVVPPVRTCQEIQFAVSSIRLGVQFARQLDESIKFIQNHTSPLCHRVEQLTSLHFPDPRLIQYDCGKLQTLDHLLRQLKVDKHRVLIFTQMARMLDILESFLCYHGYRYLRLDGATKVEHRQVLMERFNQDPKIFVFILSTRSGGLGVNLTGADTVIFYDSDWNPTMDAQAQDRCHRIGQTRDVHIYRLVSERTIEENILRKANQKKFLSDLAIEGGQFTTAFFKQNTLQDLFAEPSGLEDLVETDNVDGTKETVIDISVSKEDEAMPTTMDTQLETVLEEIEEDERDRVAAKCAKAEAKADLAEFDENIPWTADDSGLNKSGGDNNGDNPTESTTEVPNDFQSRTEQDLRNFEQYLRPIERFGVNLVELLWGDHLSGELELADEQLEKCKQEWELDQIKALRDQQEAQAENEDDEILFVTASHRGRPRLNRGGSTSSSSGRGGRMAAEQQQSHHAYRYSMSSVFEELEDRDVGEEQLDTREERQRLALHMAQSAMQKIAAKNRVDSLPSQRKRVAISQLREDDDDDEDSIGRYNHLVERKVLVKENEEPGNEPESQMRHMTDSFHFKENNDASQRASKSLMDIRPKMSHFSPPVQRMFHPTSMATTVPAMMTGIRSRGGSSSNGFTAFRGGRYPSSKLPIPRMHRLSTPRATAPQQLPPPRIVTPLRPLQFRVQYMPGTNAPLSSVSAAVSSASIMAHPTAVLSTMSPAPSTFLPSNHPPRLIQRTVPSNQLLLNTQPVILITKQIRLPDGQVLEHRMTQPIHPPMQFIQVVQRHTQPTSSLNASGALLTSASGQNGVTWCNVSSQNSVTSHGIQQSIIHLNKPSNL